jgi:signal transduction histidine kinase
MTAREKGRRPWKEGLLVLLVLLAFVAFAVSILDSQAEVGEERAGLMSLRENWGAAAAAYGLRDGARSSSSSFLVEYRAFHARPAFQKLLAADPVFLSLSVQADWALGELEEAQLRGDPEAGRFAGIFDRALGDMAFRVGAYSRERLAASRLSLAILLVALVVLSFLFLSLSRVLRATNEEEGRSRDFTRALISAQEGERLRLSRELHDAVAQDLAAAKLYCGLSGGSDATRAAELLDRSISEVREICQGLRPAELDKLGIDEASARLCAELGRAWGLDVDYASSFVAGMSFSEELEINLYRILQESLTNVRRHACARRARVSLAVRSSAIVLEVADDGKGPDESKPGLGRRGMAERASMLGGSFHFGPGPTGGSLVSVSIPLVEKRGKR